MKITMTRDDVTGAELTESQEIKITVGDASGTLDLGPDSFAALVSLANGEGPAKLAALLAPHVAPVKRGRKTSGTRDGKPDATTGATPDEIRTWAKSQGIAVNERGRVPADVRERYRDAHSGKSAMVATPASMDAESAESATDTDASGKTARK